MKKLILILTLALTGCVSTKNNTFEIERDPDCDIEVYMLWTEDGYDYLVNVGCYEFGEGVRKFNDDYIIY